jgi:hypothetical protein
MPEKRLCRELCPQECCRLLTEEKGTLCTILDVRTAEESRKKHREGAENIDFIERIAGSALRRRIGPAGILYTAGKGSEGIGPWS